MRPRPLQQDSSIIRQTGYGDLSVTAGTVFTEAFKAPAATGLLVQSFQTAGSVFENLTEEERESAREKQRQRRLRQSSLEDQLDYETDPGKREQILGEIEKLYEQEETQRDTKISEMIEDGRLLSVESLTEEFGDRLEFDAPMSRENAELLYKNKVEDEVRSAIIGKGLEDTGLAGYAALIGGSLVGAAVDPIELAAAFVPAVGVAGRAAATARFGRIGGAAAVGTAEGFTGALLTEPLYYALSNQQQLDYSMGEALLNVGVGTLLGSGIGTVRGIYNARQPNISEITTDLDIPEDILPEPIKLTREQGVKLAAQNRLNALRNYDILGGAPVARTALRQFINDQAIDVSPVIPRFVNKPVDLLEFVKDKGGIKIDGESLATEIKSLKVSNIKAARDTSSTLTDQGALNRDGNTIRKMVRTAYNAGYLESRDTKEFLSKLQETASGRYVFSKNDADKAADWRSYYQGDTDFASEQSHRAAIAAQVKDLTGKDLTTEEVAILSKTMSDNNLSLEDAAENVQLKLYDAQAKKLAEYGASPNSDIGADLETSSQVDEILSGAADEPDLDADLAQMEPMMRQLQDADELTKDDLKEIAKIQQADEALNQYQNVVRVAATCVSRS